MIRTVSCGLAGLMLLVAGLATSCDSGNRSPMCRVHCLPIDGSKDSACLFRDHRLDSAAMDSLWFTGEDSGHAPAEIRRISPEGKTLAAFALEPLARLAQARISGQQFLLATEDLSVGAGSYNGPLTHVLDLSQAGQIVAARDDKGHEILPMNALKSAWKLLPDGLLEASCGPDTTVDSVPFVRAYDRLRYRNGKWLRTERTAPGYTDFGDEEFPQEKEFPE